VSGHERERLSAYLDDELTPGERTEVEAHLAACPGCAAFLADLRAVDAAADGLPAEAPAGYFDTFPSRVRARLGAGSKAPARTRRLPAWTWAAAAALLLAVVAPLTLRQGALGRAPAAAPSPGGRQPALAEPEQKREREAPEVAPAAAARTPPALRASPAKAFPAAEAPPSVAGGPPPAGRSAEGLAEREAARVPLPGAPEEDASSRPMQADAPAPSALREAPVANEAFGASAGARVPARHAPAVATDSVESSARQGPLAVGATYGSEPERAFRRLETSRPRSAAEWRRQRDAWSAFAAAHPADPLADEARVRAIEAGREAWRVGGNEDDAEAVRRDVRAYLEREDALQKERVERLGPLPPRRP